MNEQTIQKEIIRNIGEIMALYPQYTTAQHFTHFLRSKGGEKAYGWDNQQLLQKIELYKAELLDDLANIEDEEEDF